MDMLEINQTNRPKKLLQARNLYNKKYVCSKSKLLWKLHTIALRLLCDRKTILSKISIIKRQYRKMLKATLFENTGISVMSGQKIRAREQKNEKLLIRASEATQAR